VFVRTRVPPASLASELRSAVFGVDPELPVSGIVVLSQELALVRRAYAIIGSAFTSLGATVLLLSLAAMYAILSFEVTRRTREIGIRVALGATTGGVLAGLVRRVGIYVLAGSVAGTGLGLLLLAVARATFVLTFPRTGPFTFVALGGLVTVAALAAAWAPARRALGVQPMDALRSE
jgi:ABC-type antimicrobial peptide transport system permease subunit